MHVKNFHKLLEKFIIYSELDIYKRIAGIAVGNTLPNTIRLYNFTIKLDPLFIVMLNKQFG
jgi:hypothetical protein